MDANFRPASVTATSNFALIAATAPAKVRICASVVVDHFLNWPRAARIACHPSHPRTSPHHPPAPTWPRDARLVVRPRLQGARLHGRRLHGRRALPLRQLQQRAGPSHEPAPVLHVVRHAAAAVLINDAAAAQRRPVPLQPRARDVPLPGVELRDGVHGYGVRGVLHGRQGRRAVPRSDEALGAATARGASRAVWSPSRAYPRCERGDTPVCPAPTRCPGGDTRLWSRRAHLPAAQEPMARHAIPRGRDVDARARARVSVRWWCQQARLLSLDATEDPREATCMAAGCAAPAAQRCGRCKSVVYCSAEVGGVRGVSRDDVGLHPPSRPR